MSDLCNLPLGLQKLRGSGLLTVCRRYKYCWRSFYSIESGVEDVRILQTNEGMYQHRVQDMNGKVVIILKLKKPWSKTPHMCVRVLNHPDVTVHIDETRDNCLLVMDDKKQPVMRLQRSCITNTIKILYMDNEELGRMKRNLKEWTIRFPESLEIKYKAAFIAACIYYELKRECALSKTSSTADQIEES